MKYKWYKSIDQWLFKGKVLVIIGARQVGKTTTNMYPKAKTEVINPDNFYEFLF